MITYRKYLLKLRWNQFKNWIKTNWGWLVGTNPYKLKPNGFCPVQIEGYTKEGYWFYFRARGNSIDFVIHEKEEDYGNRAKKSIFEKHIEDYGAKLFAAGWISHEDAIRLTTVWLNEYYEKMADLNFKFKKDYFL